MQRGTYLQQIQFTTMLRGEAVRVISSPHLEVADQVSEADALCARLINPAADERVLLFGAGQGALGVALGRLVPQGRVTLSDPHLLAVQAAEATLASNGMTNAAVTRAISLLPDQAGTFDRVVLNAPQSRALARRWLVEAHALLRPGGVLTLSGPKNLGIQSLIADATALFGAGTLLGYGSGCRVAEAVRQAESPVPPAWANEPGIAPGTWLSVDCDLPNGPAALVSLPGVFSADRLDPGTAFLLAHLPALPEAQALDIGCGYGVLGIAAAQRGAVHVTLQDVNLLAVAAAAENCARFNLAATVRAADGVAAAPGPFDLILSNPPFHAGKRTQTDAALAFLTAAAARLAPGGQLLFVANSFLPYVKLLREQGVAAHVLADNRRYQVVRVQR